MPIENTKPPKMTARQALEKLVGGSLTEVVRERDYGRVTQYRKSSGGDSLWESSVDGGITWQAGEVRAPREGDYYDAGKFSRYCEIRDNGARMEELRKDLANRHGSIGLCSGTIHAIADFVEKHTRG